MHFCLLLSAIALKIKRCMHMIHQLADDVYKNNKIHYLIGLRFKALPTFCKFPFWSSCDMPVYIHSEAYQRNHIKVNDHTQLFYLPRFADVINSKLLSSIFFLSYLKALSGLAAGMQTCNLPLCSLGPSYTK